MNESFCPSCHRQSAVAEVDGAYPCDHCGSSLLLRDQWWLPQMLGHGASGYTWKAVDRLDGSVVAIKELSFRRLTDLKQLELFEREAAALASLDHESIPTFIDHFVIEEDRFVSAYLVQEFIDGGILELTSGTDEEEVLGFLEEMADLLEYLQGRRPPVIHRDIKPTNVMRRGDGRYVLIDFGSVRTPAAATMGGSTVAGTLGYMAPEQLVGRASGGSDFYGVGATALALLAGREAHHLVEHHRPGGWKDQVEVSDGMARLLERLLEVDLDRRLKTAEALREAIEAVRSPPPPRLSRPSMPSLPARPSMPSMPSMPSLPRVRPGFLTVRGRNLVPALIATGVLCGVVLGFYHQASPGLFQEMWFRVSHPGASLGATLGVIIGNILLMSLIFGGGLVALGMFVATTLKKPEWLIPMLLIFWLIVAVESARTEIVPSTTEVAVMQKGEETRFLFSHDCGFSVTDERGRTVGLVEHRADRCTVGTVDGRFLLVEAEDQKIYAHAWTAEVFSDLADELGAPFRVLSSTGTTAQVEMQDGTTLDVGVAFPTEPTELVISHDLPPQATPTTVLHRAEVLLPSTCGGGPDVGPVVSHYSTAFGEGVEMVSGLNAQGRPEWTFGRSAREVLFKSRWAFDVRGECWVYVPRFFGDEMSRLDRSTGEVSRVLRF